MSLSYVYKKLNPEDKALLPFNAHKQYNFTSASATSFQISHFNSRFTSESFDIYSSGSSSADTINTIKYNQIDHIFYRDFLKKIHHKKDLDPHLKQERKLYEKANILSIPAGLYGKKNKKIFFLFKF